MPRLVNRPPSYRLHNASGRAFVRLDGRRIAGGWARPYVNAQVRRVRHIFKWGAGRELVPAAVFEACAIRGRELDRTGKTWCFRPALISPRPASARPPNSLRGWDRRRIMTDRSIVPSGPEGIEARIFELRGHRVMLDEDLAVIYGVKTKALNQAVKRNLRRFPGDFLFRLTKDETAEVQRLRSQSVTLL